ncbi:MAG: hypothetical protein KGH59_00595 [Candidatus Micrarchaeota archaeon]|nr:hypothetical protein [Candidatus Micrarchaeota archaeon]MDE1846835.1 hypothetical protein [Candidatus Micrarchaeota archaeon]
MGNAKKAEKEQKKDEPTAITMIGVRAAIDHGRPWQVSNLLKAGNFTFEDYVAALAHAEKLAEKYKDKSLYEEQAKIARPEDSYLLNMINPETYVNMRNEILALMEGKFGKEMVAFRLKSQIRF